MKEGWKKKKLGEVCEIIKGRKPMLKPIPKEGDLPYLVAKVMRGSGEIEYASPEDRNAVTVNESETIIICDGSNSGEIFTGFKGILSSTMGKINKKAAIDDNYLRAFLDSTFEIFNGAKTGSAIPHLDKEAMFQLDFPIPPLPEQRRIVAILDEAFEGIATAKANAEKNLQNAKALFESHLQSVFSQHGDDWKMEKLDNLTELARGHNPPKNKFSREQKPGYIRFYQIRDGATDDYVVYVPDTPQLHKMKKDDIMMVAYRHVGRAFRGVEGAFNVALCKITNVRRDVLDDDFLFHLIPSKYVKGELLKRSERSLIPSMSIEHLREIKIPLPPIREQQKLVKTITSLTESTSHLSSLYSQKLSALEELKKSLLHQAFSGAL